MKMSPHIANEWLKELCEDHDFTIPAAAWDELVKELSERRVDSPANDTHDVQRTKS